MDILKIALQEYATRDITGVQNNPRVLQYFVEIGHKWVTDDDTAWCAAFVNWCLKKANKQGTGKLNARSFLNYGAPSAKPTLGDIVILWRISPTSVFGHVGFFIKETKDTIYILGGNQSDEVNISPYPKTQVLAYRKIPEIKF